MANEERKDDHTYPLDSNCYKLVNEIGKGVSAIVYKAICTPMNNSTVAIKAIDLERTKENFDKASREAKTMTLLNHPNILKSHCSFTVESRLWVVMPFMAGGSLQSIMASSFSDGLSEPCIATVLKEILNALSYLHGQGHLHRDIKAGNILVDSNGNVKLADFGVSASIYERNLGGNSSGSSSSSSLMLNEVAGTPYWMAPEVIHSHTGYSLKADIWSFGITALELAHGRPPLSHLPPSKSLFMKISKRLRFSDHYEKTKDNKSKKFSKSFKDMVGLCLDQDPSRRPSADKLLKHSFFKNCKGADFLVKNVLLGLPSVEQRFSSEKSCLEESGDDDFSSGEIRKERRISGWSFNEEGFELDPVFPSDEMQKEGGEGTLKRVSFGGETVIPEKPSEGSLEVDEGSSKRVSFGGETIIPEKANEESLEVGGGNVGGEGTVNNKILEGLLLLKKSVEFQKQQVTAVIETHFGEGSSEMNIDEHLMKVNEDLRLELEKERQRRMAAETEIELLKLQMASEQR